MSIQQSFSIDYMSRRPSNRLAVRRDYLCFCLVVTIFKLPGQCMGDLVCVVAHAFTWSDHYTPRVRHGATAVLGWKADASPFSIARAEILVGSDCPIDLVQPHISELARHGLVEPSEDREQGIVLRHPERQPFVEISE